MATRATGIPAKFQREFLATMRKVNDGSTKGTNKIDVKVFQEVITKVFANKAFMENIAKDIVNRAVLK